MVGCITGFVAMHSRYWRKKTEKQVGNLLLIKRYEKFADLELIYVVHL